MSRTELTDIEEAENEPGLVFQHVARLRIKLIDKLLALHGLSSAQVYLLNWLFRKDGRTQVELAKLLGTGTVAVSGMVDRLEANDWVERRPDPNDRRSNRIWLKASATSKKRVISRSARSVNRTSFAGLSDEEVEQLLSLMRRVRNNLEDELEINRDEISALSSSNKKTR